MHAPAVLALTLSLLPHARAATFDVAVGANSKLAFDPQFVAVAPGDILNFVFHPKNHSVTQSAFDTPCVPLPGGADSGFQPVAADATQLPNFQVTVPDSQPMWFHCQQRGHCGQGMVFAINPPPDQSPHSFKAFQDLAIATNGTGSASSAAAASTTATATAPSGYVTPAPPQWQTATAIVSNGTSIWTTTYSSYLGTPQPTIAAQPAEHTIIVGANGQLAYSPANISAAIGDGVTFEFHPKNHTVTQSSFSSPCVPHQAPAPGFRSGFQPVAANATDFPRFRITVNDTAPIWGYCGQPGHCGAGMVFAINAVETGPNNFAAFVELARRINGTTASANGTASATGSAASTTRSSGALGRWAGAGAGACIGVAVAMAVVLL